MRFLEVEVKQNQNHDRWRLTDVLGSTETHQRQLMEFEAQETRDRRRLSEIKCQHQPSWRFSPSSVNLTHNLHTEFSTPFTAVLLHSGRLPSLARQHSVTLGPCEFAQEKTSTALRPPSALLSSHFKENLLNIIQRHRREIYVCPGLWRRRHSECPFQFNTDILRAICDWFCQQYTTLYG
jgi:hypothetical protein